MDRRIAGQYETSSQCGFYNVDPTCTICGWVAVLSPVHLLKQVNLPGTLYQTISDSLSLSRTLRVQLTER